MAGVKVTIPDKIKRLAKGVSAKGKKEALTDVTNEVFTDVTEIPPSSSANRAPAPFYIRGRGTQLKSGRNLNNSERSSVAWKFSIESATRGVIENPVSYAGPLFGENQAWFHRKRGWPNVPEYVDDPKNIEQLENTYLEGILRGIE